MTITQEIKTILEKAKRPLTSREIKSKLTNSETTINTVSAIVGKKFKKTAVYSVYK